jgi:hypothetical protein
MPVESALGHHNDAAKALRFPAAPQWVVAETGRLDLLSRRNVYDRIAGG